MRGKGIIILAVSFLLAPFMNASDGQRRGLEFFAFFSLRFDSLDSVYSHEYSPIFTSGDKSAAEQDILIQGKPASGVNGGFSFSVADSLRLRFSLDYSRGRLRGENSLYHVHIEYTARYLPQMDPVRIVRDNSLILPETRGTIRSLGFLLDLEYEAWRSKSAALRLSAGGGYYRIFGDFYPLGYSKYSLASHFTLGLWEYYLMLKLPASGRIGFNAGIELSLRLTDSLAFVSKAAYHRIGSIILTPVIDKALSTHIFEIDADKFRKIVDYLKLPPFEFNPSYWTLQAGFKLALHR